mmetsp:Transcript_141641/g.440352  ORF Transcript_141641/g.440352 Transcript_141641/m.440352 type:complete len:200 (+) Transcript_141641:327-926(+)
MEAVVFLVVVAAAVIVVAVVVVADAVVGLAVGVVVVVVVVFTAAVVVVEVAVVVLIVVAVVVVKLATQPRLKLSHAIVGRVPHFGSREAETAPPASRGVADHALGPGSRSSLLETLERQAQASRERSQEAGGSSGDACRGPAERRLSHRAMHAATLAEVPQRKLLAVDVQQLMAPAHGHQDRARRPAAIPKERGYKDRW